MAPRALKDKFKSRYFELQISPCGGAVSEKPRKPEKKKKNNNVTDYKYYIRPKYIFLKRVRNCTAKVKVMKNNTTGE